MYYILALITAVISGFTPALKKNYVTNTKDVKTNGDIYLIVNISAATLYFFLLSGCNVPLNLPTMIFSMVFALFGYASVLTGLVAYNYAAVVYITVISGALGTILPFLYELIFTDIVFTPQKIISVFFRVFAIAVILLFNREEKISKKGILICLFFGIIGGASGILVRMYARFPGVESDGSFFFWTNVFHFPLILWGVLKKTNIKTIVSGMKNIKWYNYAFALSSMVINNAITFVSIEIMRHISGTVYSVINGSIHLLASAFMSAFIYKESVTMQTFASVILSIVAVILSLI
ncbi:MAG: hypothetical protein J6A69_01935 [Clostridia bacterium]|nr:hypothetical protein [Clostridia bacterium]